MTCDQPPLRLIIDIEKMATEDYKNASCVHIFVL